MPACEVAIDTGLHGPVLAGALACASGIAALVQARQLILAGEADAVICGGSDAGSRRSCSPG
jgi:3-oxoacyl-[acyl-carrier-protein] synthase II